MLRFDKATCLSLLSKFIFSVRFSNSIEDHMFRIHKYSIHFSIIPLFNSIYCYIPF